MNKDRSTLKKFWLTYISFMVLAMIWMTIDSAQAQSYVFKNGQVFNGKRFIKADVFVENGVFVKKLSDKADSVIDLQGQYVIPPFADAHTHNLSGKWGLQAVVNKYLKEGTFYVQVLTNPYRSASQIQKQFNQPHTLDVSYAHGGLTCTFGHPFPTYEALAHRAFGPNINWEKIKKNRKVENNAYWFLDTKAQVEAKWDKIMAHCPDVIKIFLLDAANYKKLYNNGEVGGKGLSPEVAELIVKKAHQAGLKVWAHIETAEDFRLGLRIGIDGFGHMPGYGGKKDTKKFYPTMKELRQVAKKGIAITPTTSWAEAYATKYKDGKMVVDTAKMMASNEILKKEFKRYRKAGVNVVIGSDRYSLVGTVEVDYLRKYIGVYTNKELLKMWCETTAKAIYPKRKIGRITPGYEASFLTLPGNPIKDFDYTKKIRLRFKQGHFIHLKTSAKNQ